MNKGSTETDFPSKSYGAARPGAYPRTSFDSLFAKIASDMPALQENAHPDHTTTAYTSSIL